MEAEVDVCPGCGSIESTERNEYHRTMWSVRCALCLYIYDSDLLQMIGEAPRRPERVTIKYTLADSPFHSV